jgi:hypothetical protein
MIAVLFARCDSIYKTIPECDVFDMDRDALTYRGNMPVIAHPPCRAWGRLRGLAKPLPGERELAFFAVDQVRRCGGVLEHPAASVLWKAAGLPEPGWRDKYGGWTLVVYQSSFGHRAEKATRLYIVGIEPAQMRMTPLILGEASHIIGTSGRRRDGGRLRRGDSGWRPEVGRVELEATPVAFAHWLIELAESCAQLERWAA